MKTVLVVLLGSIGLFAAGPAAAADPQLMAPVRQFIDSFNKGDVKTAEAAHVPGGVAIVDEVPPYLWSGSGAVRTWAADLEKDAKARGLTDQSVTLSDPTREEVAGARAYLVVPAVYAFKEKGAAMREDAQMTFTLQKGSAGWKISGWTWTGPKAAPAR